MPSRVSRQALYLQVYSALVQRITSGNWKLGTTLPNEQELAREFGVSPGTMRKALDKLEAAQLVERRQGRGTFVLNHADGELAMRFGNIRDPSGKREVATSSRVLEQHIGLATPVEQDRLSIGARDKVLRTRRLREHRGRPYMHEEASLAVCRCPGLPSNELVGNYLITSLAQKYGTHLARATEKLSIGEAPEQIAKLLMTEPLAPVLRLERIVHSVSGEPVEWRVALCELDDEYYLAEMS